MMTKTPKINPSIIDGFYFLSNFLKNLKISKNQ